ncbi:MAG: glucokinase [Pseudomonadota bacterium]
MTALVADIGGTNARFALAEAGENGAPDLRCQRTLLCAAHGSLARAIDAYWREVGTAQRPRRAALAVASPVLGDEVRLTNNPWRFSQAALAAELGLERLHVLNDFAAIARALPVLSPAHLAPVGAAAAPRRAGDSLAVLGPGTGLGVAGLLQEKGRRHVIASEGGHISFAPLDAVEEAILHILMPRYGRLSYERLLCGEGLRILYEALGEILKLPVEALSPADITARAQEGKDALSRQSLMRFCAILGAFAGDVALMLGARQVYIAGGIVPRFIDFLRASPFRAQFEAKGRFAGLMRQTPVDVITAPYPGLIGAAVAVLEEDAP